MIKPVIDLLSAEESLARNVFDRKSSDLIESPPSLFVGVFCSTDKLIAILMG